MLKIITMTVNGKETELAVDDREALLDTLRNRLGLNSVKRGCEVGECGACTVLVDGEAIDSCIYLTMWAEGKHIMTVEGLKGQKRRTFSNPEGLCGGGSSPVRFLHTGPDHERCGNRGNRKEIQQGRAEKADLRASVPLYGVREYSECNGEDRGGDLPDGEPGITE